MAGTSISAVQRVNSFSSRRNRWLVAAVGSVLLGATGVSGTARAAAATLLPSPTPLQQLAGLRERGTELRHVLAQPTVYSRVVAAAMASGKQAALTGLQPPSPAPVTLGAAVDMISHAVHQADAIVTASPAYQYGMRMGWQRVLELAVELPAHPEAAPKVPASVLDPSPALRASGIIALAVDTAMPELINASHTTPPAPAGSSTGCDIRDQPPDLCVAGPGVNHVFTKDYGVMIVLGGNNTYLNNAGANEPGIAAAVAVDVGGGTDLYNASEPLAQGSGALGVGMLINLSGQDTYENIGNGRAAEGQGLGFFGGAGFLIDGGGGGDVFSESSTFTGLQSEGRTLGAAGQGEGFFGGVAVVSDAGMNNSYSLSSLATPSYTTLTVNGQPKPFTLYGTTACAGQGLSGFGGAAVFFDGGGTESFAIHSDTAPAPATAPPVHTVVDPLKGNTPYAYAGGQNETTLGGATFSLLGPGAKTFNLMARLEAAPLVDNVTTAEVYGQGYAIDAPGDFSDPGGNDTFSMQGGVASAVTFNATDGCTCDTAVVATRGPISMVGQDEASTGAALFDVGTAKFSARSAGAVRLRINDKRTSAASAPLIGDASAPTDVMAVQGVANGGTAGLDVHRGFSSFGATAVSSVTASGSAGIAANQPSIEAWSSGIQQDAQAVGANNTGAAEILHEAGNADVYRTSAVASVQVGTAPSALVPVVTHVQAAADPTGIGLLVDVNKGTKPDAFSQVPAYPACTGTRGTGVWEDCNHIGIGVVGP